MQKTLKEHGSTPGKQENKQKELEHEYWALLRTSSASVGSLPPGPLPSGQRRGKL